MSSHFPLAAAATAATTRIITMPQKMPLDVLSATWDLRPHNSHVAGLARLDQRFAMEAMPDFRQEGQVQDMVDSCVFR
jgi:hypothetical protein